MIKITIDKKKYYVPNDFTEVSIGLYQKLTKIDSEDEIDKLVDYMKILTGLDRDTILKVELNDIRKITKNLLTLFNKGDYKVVDAVKIDGTTYVFDKDLENMKFNMFIDLEEMTKDKEVVNDYLHLIMAILYRPVKRHSFLKRKKVLKPEKYNSSMVKDRAEFFKENMMMDKVMGSLFFFMNLRMEYIKIMTDCLRQKKEKEVKVVSTI